MYNQQVGNRAKVYARRRKAYPITVTVCQYSVEEGKIAKEAGESPGREAQHQALAQEVQQLRKALQEHCALQRRLAASTQGGGQGRARERKLRKLTHAVGKLKDLLAEREESMWEQDCQLRELEERSPWQDPRQVDAVSTRWRCPTLPLALVVSGSS